MEPRSALVRGLVEPLELGARARAGGWWEPSFVTLAAALVAAMRGLYDLRYGWDPGWMGYSYLETARLIALGRSSPGEEPPLTPVLEVAIVRAGASPLFAQALLHLAAHLAMLLGILGLAAVIWPAAPARRRALVVLTVAVLPLLSCETGRSNLGALVGAALATCALALAATEAARPRLRPWRLALAAAVGGLACCARFEAVATCLGGALALALVGRRWRDLPAHRAAAAALLAGCALGQGAQLLQRWWLTGAALVPGATYALYTFYDGLPFLMFPDPRADEYDRYRAAVAWFGSFEENHGSVLRALLAHPVAALLRVAAKPLDLMVGLLWIHALTPLGVAAAIAGARRCRDRLPGAHRAWLLLAWVPALALLFVPQLNPAYALSLAAPLALAISRGLERWTAALSPAAARRWSAVALAGSVLLVAGFGKATATNHPLLNRTAAWLERRCAGGCLVNILPQAVERQVWLPLDAGFPLPPRPHRSEDAISGAWFARHEAEYGFCNRVNRARAAGFRGPALWVELELGGFAAFGAFDGEVRHQRRPDLLGSALLERLQDGPADQVSIYRLPDDRPCVDAPPLEAAR